MRKTNVVLWTLIALLLATVAVAQTKKEADHRFEIVSKDGSSVVVTGALWYSGQYAYPVYDGILVKQAGGETKVPWSKLKTVNITDTGKPVTEYAIVHVMEVELVFADPKAKPQTHTLVPGNLRGKTDLGEFNASLGDLKSITPR